MRGVLALCLTLPLLDCRPLPPLSSKVVVKIVLGVDGEKLIADDGSVCRALDYQFNAGSAVRRASIGDTFECNWHPKTAAEAK